MESDVTGHRSVMTSTTGKPPPKKRGRKRKADLVSVVSGGKPTAKDAASTAGQQAEDAEEEDDEADAEEGVQGDQDKEQKRKDKANIAYAASIMAHCLHGYPAARSVLVLTSRSLQKGPCLPL